MGANPLPHPDVQPPGSLKRATPPHLEPEWARRVEDDEPSSLAVADDAKPVIEANCTNENGAPLQERRFV